MAVYYVSPSGNDAWSGTSANGSGTSGPFATLARAQRAVEASPGGNTVYVEAGTYTLLAPLSLTSADSNTSFLAYQGQRPLLSGGAAVSGWTVGANGVWTAHVALNEVDQLTVNGVAQQQARAPNYDPANPVEGGWAWARTLPSGYDAHSNLAFDKGVFNASQLAAGDRVVVITADGYTARVMTIASVNYSAGVMSFQEQTDADIGPGARFFVEGAKSLLDTQGEWSFDKTTKTLSFLPPAGFAGTGAVAAGGNNDLIDVNGATGITIRGLAFANQASNAGNVVDTAAAINVSGSSGLTIAGNQFQNLDEGVRVGDSSRNVTVSGNTFNNLASAAVELAPNSSQNTVVNNAISNVNTVYRTYGGIQITESWGNDVAHNLIQDVPRSGINDTNYDPSIKSGNNTIEYNKILHTGQETPDTGSIYVVANGDAAALGDTIRYNYVSDSGGKQTNGPGFVPGNTYSWGIYLDDGSSNAKVYGNFVTGTAFGGFQVHTGTGNQLYDNVFVNSAGQYNGWLQDDGVTLTGTSVYDNVIAVPANGNTPVGFDAPTISPSYIHDNVYVNPTGAPITASFDGTSYAQWQAEGGDAGSVVTSSAGFVNEAAGDYTFAAGSAALAKGIPQLPFSQMGPTTGTPTPTPTPTPASDTLTLRMSEDAYQGDAQFVVRLDGTQIGGAETVSALHAAGADNVLDLTGSWGKGPHAVQIKFINDAYGGTPATDRNLYVDSIAYDGVTGARTSATMLSNGTHTFNIGGTAAAAPADALTLHLAEDAYQGDAQFRLTIDGRQLTTAQPVTASHASGAWQDLSFAGNFGAGRHTIGVSFGNDAYGGSSVLDRNLYVNGIDLNGRHYGSGVSGLFTTGSTASFSVTTAA